MKTRALPCKRCASERWNPICYIFRIGGAEMICKVSCSIFLLASAVLAQQRLMPGTLASTAVPDSDGEASTSSFNPASSSSSDARQPITAQERIQWVVKGTIGPEGLAGELFGAGWGTLFNSPKDIWHALGRVWRSLGMSVARKRDEQHDGSGAGRHLG